MLKISICDDEAAVAAAIRKILEEEAQKAALAMQISVFTDAGQCFEKILSGVRTDVLLLDIDMNGLDGIRLARTYGAALAETLLIFVSSHEERVFDSFHARPFRFIPKEKFRELSAELLRDVVRELRRKASLRYTFKTGAVTVSLPPEQIVYVESFRKNQVIHTAAQDYELTYSFARIYEELRAYGFIQIHKSFLVNYRFIRSIDVSCVLLENGIRLPIGRTRRQQIKTEFQEYIMRDL